MATVTRTTPTTAAETRRLPATTGALSGLLVIVLGVWGGLIPFIGPYFHYAFGGYHSWHYTSERLWLDILPGAVAIVGGFLLLTSTRRTPGLIGGWLAILAGGWFAIGPWVSLLWHHNGYPIGAPMGGYTRQMLEWLGFFELLGILIATLGAFAMGRYFSRPRLVTEGAIVAEDAALAAEERHEERRAARAEEPIGTRTHEPMATTAAGEPVAARDETMATRANEPVTRADEPVTRANEPVTRADEPVTRANEPVPHSDESVTRADEPAATGANEPSAIGNEPAATADQPATASDVPATETATYRRRPGLSRFRRQ